MSNNNEDSKSMDFGFQIQTLAKKIKYLADDNLVKHNLTLEQVKIMRFLHDNSKILYVYQKEIEKKFNIRRSSVTNILQNMEKHGLIIRTGDESDARIRKVFLTDKGMELSYLLKDFITNLEMEIVTGMSVDEKELFIQFIKRALSNVEALMNKNN